MAIVSIAMHVCHWHCTQFHYCGNLHAMLVFLNWVLTQIINSQHACQTSQSPHAKCIWHMSHHFHIGYLVKAHVHACLVLGNCVELIPRKCVYCKIQGHGPHLENHIIMCTPTQSHAWVSTPHKRASPKIVVCVPNQVVQCAPQCMHFQQQKKGFVGTICNPTHA
jgi:hypothetical protein